MRKMSVLVTVILMGIVLSVSVVNATWCNSDYDKRINVSINNTAGSALTDYQVYVNLSSNPINETSLRVYNATSCMLRSYWSENTTAGNSYGIWINYSAIAGSGWSNNTAIYYNNSSVSSVSNITTTFIIGDDFNDASKDSAWTEFGNWTESGGVLSYVNEFDTYAFFYQNVSAIDVIAETKLRPDFTGGSDHRAGIGARYHPVTSPFIRGHSFMIMYDDLTKVVNLDEGIAWGTAASTGYTFTVGTWYNFKIYVPLSGDTGINGKAWTIGTQEPSGWQCSDTFTSYSSKTIGLRGSYTDNVSFDDFRVRKYVATEPSTTLGSEEQQSGIVLTLTTPTEDQEFSTTTIWINGTTNVNATINFSIDAGVNETACTNCVLFQNLTSTLFEGNHNVTVYAINYTDSSDTDTEMRNFTINSLAPQWGNQTQNVSFIYHNESINLSANGYDATGLNYAWLATNETGTWQNFTTIDTRVEDYQNLTNDYIHTAECGSHDTFTAYSELTGDHSKYLFSYTPTSNSVQAAAFGWYFPGNNTWAEHVIYNSTAVDANSLIVINETRWLYQLRKISDQILYEMWTNDGGETWTSLTVSPLNAEFAAMLFVPIENDSTKAIAIDTLRTDSTSVNRIFFYRGNESYSNKSFLWTKGEAGEFLVSKIICLNNTYYMIINSRSGSAYAKYVNSTDLISWSSPVVTDIPHRVGQFGVGWSVDCDKDTCYAVTANPNSPYRQELYSINKSLFTTNSWTYRLDLNVTDAWHGTLKVINDTHLIASARDHSGVNQYGILVKTHTETNSQYGSPLNLGGSTNWEWANFTWQNAAYNNTKIYWKICFNDTSGLTNCTDVMSFDIKENATPTLHIGDAINIKEDWGRDFDSNLSANVTSANASGVWMNFTNAEFTNTSLGWVNLTLNEWINESHNANSPVSNISVDVYLNSTTLGATNGTDSFWYEVTNRTNTATMDSAATHNANTSEIFYVNATCNEEYGDTFLGGANLLEDGVIIDTDTSVIDYVNFSHSEAVAGVYNYTVRFYNLTHYDNATTPTYSNVTVTEPTYMPPNPINLQNTSGNYWVNYTWSPGILGNVTDLYNVSWNDTWYNDTTVTYMNDSVGAGNWANITVYAYNSSGTGTLSSGSVSDEVKVSDAPPGDYIPPDPTNIQNSTGVSWVNYTWDVGGGNVTNSYNVSWNLTWYNGTTNMFMQKDVGCDKWANISVYAFNSSGTGSLSIGSVSHSVHIPDFYVPNDTSYDLMTRGNFWVNHTWSTPFYIGDNDTDSYNYSVNSTWYNGSFVLSHNNSDLSPHGWSNITIWGYNDSCNASLSNGDWSDDVQLLNNVPVLTGLPDNTTDEDVNQTDIFDLDDYFTDVDGDTPTYLVESNNQSAYVDVTINASNNVSYTLASGWNGTAEIVINVTDGYGGEDNDTFLIIVNAAPLPGDYIPGDPTTLANTTGNYWVNYTWNVGGGNVTDSYNVSWNLTWYNTTTDTFMKKEVGASNWANITIYAYNSSGNGSLSTGSVSDNVQAPAFVPGDYIPPTPTTLQNTTGNYYVNYTWVMGVPSNITDSYNVSWNLSWFNGTLTTYMQKEVGASGWANITVYAFNSSGNGSLSAGYISDEVQAPSALPGDYPPATPTTLANTTGNSWVHYTWSSGGGANITDSYNVSWNLSWYNNTLVAYMNDTVGEFGWANISVWAFNSSGNGSMSAGSISDETQADGGTFTTSMGTTVYNLITYYGSSNSTAEQFGVDIGSVDYIAMYNGSFYTHTMGFSANNFTTYHGIGYYVYLNASGSSTYQRNNISDVPYNTQLFNRWNTVGWTNATDTNAEGVAISIGSVCKYTSSLNADGVTYTTHTVGFTSNNHDVDKGKGYWVWVNTNTNWNRNS